jgi:WD40 repeat protein
LANLWHGSLGHQPSASARSWTRPVWLAGVLAAVAALLPGMVVFVESDWTIRPIEVYDAADLGGEVHSVTISEDGKRMAAASFGWLPGDRGWSVDRWRLDIGQRGPTTRSGPAQTETFYDGGVTATGDLWARGNDGLFLYDTAGRRMPGGPDVYQSAYATPTRLVTVDYDDVFSAWPAQDGRPVTLLRGGGDSSRDELVTSTDGTVAAAVGFDGTRVWDVRKGTNMVLPDSRHDINMLALSADGSTLAHGSQQEDVIVWRRDGARFSRISQLRVPMIYEMVVSPNGALIAIAADIGGKSALEIWNTTTGEHLVTLPHSVCVVTAIAFGGMGGEELATGCGHQIKLWNVPDLIRAQARL